jgi:hypothetical protein
MDESVHGVKSHLIEGAFIIRLWAFGQHVGGGLYDSKRGGDTVVRRPPLFSQQMNGVKNKAPRDAYRCSLNPLYRWELPTWQTASLSLLNIMQKIGLTSHKRSNSAPSLHRATPQM